MPLNESLQPLQLSGRHQSLMIGVSVFALAIGALVGALTATGARRRALKRQREPV